MLLAVTVLLALVCAALVIERLLWHAQCAAWARQLEELPPDSNAELSAGVQSPDSLRLCRAINARLRQSREGAAKAGSRLNDSKLIHRAQAVLAQRAGISESSAYQELRRLSMDKRVPMAVLARSILEQEPRRKDKPC